MRKEVKKWFWAWDFDKEETWLNEMAAKGLVLVGVGFCRYVFEDCRPGEYQIALQCLEHKPDHPESVKYLEFMEETGAEYIGSFSSWVYLRKKTEDGYFELFSDNTSRIRHLTGIIRLLMLISGVNLGIFGYNLMLLAFFHNPINYIAIVNLLISLLGFTGAYRLWKKRSRLKAEQQVFEG